MHDNSFLSELEIQRIGFKRIGKGCLISRNARFYGAQNMTIGNYVRIDDFCILSGKVTLGSYIHISAFVVLYGSQGIEIEDYAGISARSTVYSAMDDFSGNYLIGPMIPEGKTHVTGGKVTIKKYAQISAHCLIFPGLVIGEGVIVGACSMVKCSLREWGVYFGVPATFYKERNKNLISLI